MSKSHLGHSYPSTWFWSTHQPTLLPSYCGQCLKDNKTLDSTYRAHSGFRSKSGIHHYHYENNLWHLHITLCSILMAGQSNIHITNNIYIYVKIWYLISITLEMWSSVFSHNSLCALILSCFTIKFDYKYFKNSIPMFKRISRLSNLIPLLCKIHNENTYLDVICSFKISPFFGSRFQSQLHCKIK
jgi:hypothetical protein